MKQPMDIVILGLAVTSSWGNGHATTYRSLIRGLAARGHRVLFLERDEPWYRGNRDEPQPAGAHTELYEGFDELVARFEGEVSKAALVIVGSFVPDGVRVGQWVTSIAKGVTAFYDIDTPITLGKLAAQDYEYITPELIRRYQIYLSFTGGPVLRQIERGYGAAMARALYCSVDPESYRAPSREAQWDLGYLGTYSEDRQPALDELLLEPARQSARGRFAVAGAMYPKEIEWPENVHRTIHLSPREHPGFYASQRFTLNITREAMRQAGHSPSVRLFEAASCAVPIISDWWEGLDCFFEIDREALLSSSCEDTLRILSTLPETRRVELGHAARRRVLAEHTSLRRAIQLESYWEEANDYISSHPPRRYGRRGQVVGGALAGVASQSNRKAPGETTGDVPGDGADSGAVHKPAGAGHGNRGIYRPDSWPDATAGGGVG